MKVCVLEADAQLTLSPITELCLDFQWECVAGLSETSPLLPDVFDSFGLFLDDSCLHVSIPACFLREEYLVSLAMPWSSPLVPTEAQMRSLKWIQVRFSLSDGSSAGMTMFRPPESASSKPSSSSSMYSFSYSSSSPPTTMVSVFSCISSVYISASPCVCCLLGSFSQFPEALLVYRTSLDLIHSQRIVESGNDVVWQLKDGSSWSTMNSREYTLCEMAFQTGTPCFRRNPLPHALIQAT